MTNIVLDRPLTVDEARTLRPALLAFREHSSYTWYTEGDIDTIIGNPEDYTGTSSPLLGRHVAQFLTQFQTYAREHNEQVQEWLGTVSHGETVAEPTDRTGLARAMMTSRRREQEANESLTRRNEQVAALQAELAEMRGLHANQAASIMEMQAENRRVAATIGIIPQPGRNWYDLGFRSQGDYREFCIKAATSAARNEHCGEYDEIASDIGLLDRDDLAEEKEVRIVIYTTVNLPLGKDVSDLEESDLEEAVESWVRSNSISDVIEEV